MASIGELQQIVGINAWTPDTAVATIGPRSHFRACAEERFRTQKHVRGYPSNAITWATASANVGIEQSRSVAYPFNPRRFEETTYGGWGIPSYLTGHLDRIYKRLARLEELFPGDSIHAVDHHLAHSLYSFAASEFDDALVVALDAIGEFEAGAAYVLSKRSMSAPERVWTLPYNGSLGAFYAAVTRHLGFQSNDEEGTVMALAARGNTERYQEAFSGLVKGTGTDFELQSDCISVASPHDRRLQFTDDFVAKTVPRRVPGAPIEQRHADFAASAQLVFECTLVTCLRELCSRTRQSNLVLCGGVALNCVANAVVAESLSSVCVFVPPAPGDDGAAAGAAIACAAYDGRALPPSVRSPFVGPEFRGEASAVLRGLNFDRKSVENTPEWVADKIASGAIVAMVHGGAEFGPRALGNRSILASATLPGITSRVNSRIKNREAFRPFAPVVRKEDYEKWFGPLTKRVDGRHMSFALKASDEFAEVAPEAVHSNGRARVQVVSSQSENPLAAVLNAASGFGDWPVIFNTSLNVKGQPIVNDTAGLGKLLSESGLSHVVINGVAYARA